MRSCFITGGLGFIGYHLCQQLIQKDCRPVVYDPCVSYLGTHSDLHAAQIGCRLRDLGTRIEHVAGDLGDPVALSKAMQAAQPEVVVHLAAVPLPTVCARNPEQALSVNVVGLGNLLATLRHVSSVKRLVFVSSSYVLGHFQQEPAGEAHPITPVDIYGATKLAGEVLAAGFARSMNIEFVVIRPSAVYGPTDANRRVVQIFVENALTGTPLVVRNGSNRLDFTFCEDLAQGLLLAIEHPDAADQVFHLTRGQGRSIHELADIVKQAVPDARVVQGATANDGPKRGTLDVSKAAVLLDYRPRISLEEGVALYVAFVRSQIESGVTPPTMLRA